MSFLNEIVNQLGSKFSGSENLSELNRILITLIISAWLAGCATNKPILYPNDHLRATGQETAEREIQSCRRLAEGAGASAGPSKAGQVAGGTAIGAAIGGVSGTVAGAIVGSVGTGSAIGAASGATIALLRALFSKAQSSPAYENFVNKCLEERGYLPVGWET